VDEGLAQLELLLVGGAVAIMLPAGGGCCHNIITAAHGCSPGVFLYADRSSRRRNHQGGRSVGGI
jgi:hypothetical protein